MSIKLNESAFVLIDLQEKLLPKIHESDTIISNCLWLNNLAQKLNVPTMVAEQYPKGLGRTYAKIREKLPQSVIVEKLHFSAARNIEFIDKLAALDKKRIILCGIEAHVCVLQTALDLHHMDYKVHVVADAIGSRHEFDKSIALSRMQHHNISIVTKEMVLFEWLEQAGTDLFKSVSNEFLK